LLFFATTINYIDRQVLGILAPVLQKEIGWDEIEYGLIVTAFQGAYALGLLLVGRLIDRFGTKIGYALSLFVWSIAAMAHATVSTVVGFAVARFSLGLGESGNFPAAIKAVAEWFPKKERALATGVFNSGANIGAVFAPLVVPWLTLEYGWQSAFLVTGALGLLWLVCWVPLYDRPEVMKRLSGRELAYIQSDPPEPTTEKMSWKYVMRYRQTWAFVLGKFLTDPVWWFYLFWLPKLLNKNYGLTLDKLGLPLIIIYSMTTIGSIGGGWLSSTLIAHGWDINKSRKSVMLLCALCWIPVVFASEVTSLWVAVVMFGLAAAAHQGWSANLFTTSSDMFPKKAIGTIVGIGGMAGSVGGMLLSTVAGVILEVTGSYSTLFIISASAYLVALLTIHLLVPQIKPIEFES
jgi:ACS family hexuronate transporter-like MFS transporter